jgi:hypothetical protein
LAESAIVPEVMTVIHVGKKGDRYVIFLLLRRDEAILGRVS